MRERWGGLCVSLERARTFSPRLKRNESSPSVQNYFHLDSLQKKLKDLEEENVVLRSEASVQPALVPQLPYPARAAMVTVLFSAVTQPVGDARS